MELESECNQPAQNAAPENNAENTNPAEKYCNTEKDYTYDDLMKDAAAERKSAPKPVPKPEPKKAENTDGEGPTGGKNRIFASTYTFLRTSRTGKAICATTLALALAAGSAVYGARNANQVNGAVDGTVGRVSRTVQVGAGALTDRVDYVLNGNPQIGEFLEKKKGEYEAVLKSEPTNKEAQKELTRLEALIGAYKQIYNSNE